MGRWEQRECSMRGLAVVVGRVDAEGPLEVAAAKDQQPVEALGSDGANETLGAGVCLWRPDRVGFQNPVPPGKRGLSGRG
jgi:hypothetical protein